MRLYLFRHGIASEPDDPNYPKDDERPLTSRGARRTLKAARGLAMIDVDPDLILTSPLVRARQTAEIVARVLQYPESRIEVTKALRPERSPREFLDLVKTRIEQSAPASKPSPPPSPANTGGETAWTRISHVFCTGHAPQLDLLLAELCVPGQRPFTALQKCACASLESTPDVDGRETWELLWLLSPRQLRNLGSIE